MKSNKVSKSTTTAEPVETAAQGRKKMRESLARWKREDIDRNKRVIARLCEMSGKHERHVVWEILEAALPTIGPEYKMLEMFTSGQWVQDVTFLNGKREAMGFKDGKLVICDGVKYRPISLKQSLAWYAEANKKWDNAESDQDAVTRWCKMIAKAL